MEAEPSPGDAPYLPPASSLREAATRLGASGILDRLLELRSGSVAESELDLTDQGKARAEQLRGQLARCLDAMAKTRGLRRRASALDVTDFEAAHDDLVNPAPRPRELDIIADVLGYVGAAFLGYAINIWTGSGPEFAKGHLAGIAAFVLSGAAIAIKNTKVK